ncbi:MAG: hypothetical protein HY965_02505 [Ignavibacteriales bacterium]|nr:hypothetical protein [Ignavibacteriales bacterium]
MKQMFLYTVLCLAFCHTLSVADEKPTAGGKTTAISKKQASETKNSKAITVGTYITPILSPAVLKVLQPEVYKTLNAIKVPRNTINGGC